MTTNQNPSDCPACKEPVKEGWKFCPACEHPLGGLVCPQCGIPVKLNWKRCPECEARLVCKSCGRRIQASGSGCPVCDTGSAPQGVIPIFNETVTGMVMVRVAGGTFQMGDTFGAGIENEQPVHPVNLTDFYIAKYPVTQAQWTCLMPENPSRSQGDRLPVEQVNWEDIQAFIKKINAAHAGRYEFLLPSEAQWEYAARSGGKEELYAGGNDIDKLAWYENNSEGRIQPVGGRAPNGLDLYDMSGNVWEWCRDTYREDAYKLHTGDNPVNTQKGSDRVIRGGGWNVDAWSARCSRRFSYPVGFFGPSLGFRLVMIPTGNMNENL
ncbi:MAG: SUMF1/EgtB/PvdO family nonheme iron enzyme [Planctomycetes bacterium]|nr:SUMF1/EgtB/PvdO family nonheme iron enzyme [Planctomycetota bacterium]